METSDPSRGDSEIGPKIVVLGSLNGDIILKVNKLPQAGETLATSSLSKANGGKGMNYFD